MKAARVLLMASIVVVRAIAESASDAKAFVGSWNDGRIAENTTLRFAADGSGKLISLPDSDFLWSFDAASAVVTLRLRPGSTHESTLSLRYDTERDLLTCLTDESRAFKRLDAPRKKERPKG